MDFYVGCKVDGLQIAQRLIFLCSSIAVNDSVIENRSQKGKVLAEKSSIAGFQRTPRDQKADQMDRF
jgi:hypothetical protein